MKIKPDCVCNYCIKRKEGRCGRHDGSKVKNCMSFSYLGEKSGFVINLRKAKRLDGLLNKVHYG
jgi:hypothetical protein